LAAPSEKKTMMSSTSARPWAVSSLGAFSIAVAYDVDPPPRTHSIVETSGEDAFSVFPDL
jgi:hypothetical protein